MSIKLCENVININLHTRKIICISEGLIHLLFLMIVASLKQDGEINAHLVVNLFLGNINLQDKNKYFMLLVPLFINCGHVPTSYSLKKIDLNHKILSCLHNFVFTLYNKSMPHRRAIALFTSFLFFQKMSYTCVPTVYEHHNKKQKLIT